MRGRMKAYADTEAWFADAADWQKPIISTLRGAIASAADFEQMIKYGNLFFLHRGPAVLIRHEPERLLLGFFRGKRLRDMEPRLKLGGKYELANLVLREGDTIEATTVAGLAAKAALLNDELGDPTSRSER